MSIFTAWSRDKWTPTNRFIYDCGCLVLGEFQGMTFISSRLEPCRRHSPKPTRIVKAKRKPTNSK